MKLGFILRLQFSLFLLISLTTFQSSISSSLPSSEPIPLLSLRIKPNLTASSCAYTVQISTSCTSTSYTRDRVSLSFGDAYGNQVYVPRLDDPSSRAFERCSTDTFDIYGPCTYDICYVYLYRSGRDGWKPGKVRIYGTYTRAVTFNYNAWVPSNVWYGFNYCNGYSSKGRNGPHLGILVMVIVAVLFMLLGRHFC